MGHQHTPVEVDPQSVQRAQEMWHNVTYVAKWSIVAIVILVAVLGAVFIHWT